MAQSFFSPLALSVRDLMPSGIIPLSGGFQKPENATVVCCEYPTLVQLDFTLVAAFEMIIHSKGRSHETD